MSIATLSERAAQLSSPSEAACALVFLHELNRAPYAPTPPAQADWSALAAQTESALGGALDQACAACAARWPTQLEGFFPTASFREEHPRLLKDALRAVEGLLSEAAGERRQFDRREALAVTHQELERLRAKEGFSTTPWGSAVVMVALICGRIEERRPSVHDPTCGAGVLLCAALEHYRAQVGPEAARAMTLIGVDKDERVCRLARATLLLAGADPDQYWIGCGDTLTQPLRAEASDGSTRPPAPTRAARGLHPERQPALGGSGAQPALVIPSRVLHRHISDAEQAPKDRAPRRSAR